MTSRTSFSTHGYGIIDDVITPGECMAVTQSTSLAIDDGPMIVLPGSHTRGAISADDAVAARTAGETACPVDAGGVLITRPLLLHRSSKATGTSRRRVLHFLFGPAKLPFGLPWQRDAA